MCVSVSLTYCCVCVGGWVGAAMCGCQHCTLKNCQFCQSSFLNLSLYCCHAYQLTHTPQKIWLKTFFVSTYNTDFHSFLLNLLSLFLEGNTKEKRAHHLGKLAFYLNNTAWSSVCMVATGPYMNTQLIHINVFFIFCFTCALLTGL